MYKRNVTLTTIGDNRFVTFESAFLHKTLPIFSCQERIKGDDFLKLLIKHILTSGSGKIH